MGIKYSQSDPYSACRVAEIDEDNSRHRVALNRTYPQQHELAELHCLQWSYCQITSAEDLDW